MTSSKTRFWEESLSRVESAVAALENAQGANGRRDAEDIASAVAELRSELEAGEVLPPPVGNQVNSMEIVGHLAAGVAHEINNILFVIRGSAELARLNLAAGDPLNNRLMSIGSAVDRANDLTAMVLHAARNPGGAPPPIPLYPVVKEAVKLATSALDESVKVRQNIAADVSPVVLDPIKAHVVIAALLEQVSAPLGQGPGMLSVTLNEKESARAGANGKTSAVPVPCLLLSVACAGGEAAEDVIGRLTNSTAERDPVTPREAGIPGTITEVVEGLGGQVAAFSVGSAELCIEVLLPVVKPSGGADGEGRGTSTGRR